MLRQAQHRSLALSRLAAAAACGQWVSPAGGQRGLASGAGPTTATPPDAARGATADLADVFVPDPVDVVTEQHVHIMEPVFR